MKILFVASECVPFSKTGGLADVVGALPRVLAARGHQVSVFVPRYRRTPPGDVILSGLHIPLGPASHRVDIQQGPTLDGVEHFFLDYPRFYDRENLYTDGGKDYPDNAERFALFARAALALIQHNEVPDLIHCHDWQAALVPVLLRTEFDSDPRWARVATLLTVHNFGYQGLFPAAALDRIGLPRDLFTLDRLEFWGKLNFLKGGLVFADHLTTVSRRYAQEIQTEDFGFGLEGVLRHRATHLTGILNGVDYSQWDPRTDPHLVANYSPEDLQGKQLCKKDLLEVFKLPATSLKRPLVGIVSRFVTQKGFDLITEVADLLMREDLRVVALGAGEPEYEELFRTLARRFPRRFAVRIAYDNVLAHKIEGGSDLFLMPSRYEPCGLNQIYSLRYGTVPLVRATGGLDDTIEPFDPATGQGTGFKFAEYTGVALLACLRDALRLYTREPQLWRRLMLNGMECDFSWERSAADYEQLYSRLVKNRNPG